MSTSHKSTTAACSIGATLWALSIAAAQAPGAMPGDEAMTCAQIAAELGPYMQRMTPGVTDLAATGQEVIHRGNKRVAEERPAAVGLTAAALGSMADPTGLSGKAAGQAEAAHQAEVWQRAETEDKPLNDKYRAQAGAVAAQGQQLQSDARVQRLMKLAEEKHCDAG